MNEEKRSNVMPRTLMRLIAATAAYRPVTTNE